MSVDDRLRQAFGETDRSWEAQVPEALAALTARHRHENVARRGGAAALVAAAAVATVIVVTTQGEDDSPQPAPSPAPTQSVTTAAAGSPLDGTWLSGPLTRDDVRRAARQAGDAADAQAMLAGLPPTPFRVELFISVGAGSSRVTLLSSADDEVADQENLEATGDQLALRPRFGTGGGENLHAWVVEDGVLRLSFVSTTEPADSDGVPAEAWQRLLYDTAAFTR